MMIDYSYWPVRQLDDEIYAYIPPAVLAQYIGREIETNVKGYGHVGARLLDVRPDGMVPAQIYKVQPSPDVWVYGKGYREFHYSEFVSLKPDSGGYAISPAGGDYEYRPAPLLGLAGLLTVLGSYIAYEEFLKYRAVIVRCMYDHPYQWDKMEECLKSNGVDGPTAANIISTIKTVYTTYLKAKSIIPNPNGYWQLEIGDKVMNVTFKTTRTLGDETVVEGTYCCSPSGRMEGTLMLGTMRGTWQDTSDFVLNKPTKGRMILNFEYDDQGNPIVRGSFGFNENDNTFPVTGRQVAEHQEGTRQMEILGCLNKWTTITFADGTKVQAYLTSLDFTSVTGFVTRSSIRTLTCQGVTIETAQQAEACMNNWVQVTLPNGITLSLNMTSYDDTYIGGTLRTSELMALSDRIAQVEC